MFSEIVHGLISRTQSDSGVDQNCPEETLVPCDIRIGIIPAGESKPLKGNPNTAGHGERNSGPPPPPHTSGFLPLWLSDSRDPIGPQAGEPSRIHHSKFHYRPHAVCCVAFSKSS